MKAGRKATGNFIAKTLFYLLNNIADMLGIGQPGLYQPGAVA